MRIGTVRETLPGENRVALTPAGAAELVRDGHEVWIERDAGVGSYFANADYELAGACIAESAGVVWEQADLLLKVKQPLPEEYSLMQPRQILFTYLHLAADAPLVDALVDSGITALAYETVTLPDGRLPLLAPMSEVAGRLAPQMGAMALTRGWSGRGLLVSGVPGVDPARIVIIGGGVVGYSAAVIALGLGADVWLLDTSIDRLRQLETVFGSQVRLLASTASTIKVAVRSADIVIGAVLLPGGKAPRLLDREMLSTMKPGSALVDVAIDQGGVLRDERPNYTRRADVRGR
jgi:alanine dehydrogenase